MEISSDERILIIILQSVPQSGSGDFNFGDILIKTTFSWIKRSQKGTLDEKLKSNINLKINVPNHQLVKLPSELQLIKFLNSSR